MKNGNKRKVQSAWFKDHKWLRYSVLNDALYCAPCLLFGKSDAKEKTFINPVTDWSNISGYFKRHEKSDSSHYKFFEMADNFLQITSDSKPSISVSLESSRAKQVEINKHILRKIIENLILCGRQNIAIRGHTEDRSNFMAILQYLATEDEVLHNHLTCPVNPKAKYTSPDIQNELLSIIGKQIRDKLIQDCNNSRFFTLPMKRPINQLKSKYRCVYGLLIVQQDKLKLEKNLLVFFMQKVHVVKLSPHYCSIRWTSMK